jgi:predicted phage-related endonuclease
MPKEYKDAIDALTKANKELVEHQKQLDSTIQVYKNEVKQVDNQIDNIKEKTTIIREYYHEQSVAANNYTPTQVDSFFKARYNY